jgi:hypothetical protein
LATPNYAYEKRQRELAKKRKAEEKRQRKQQAPHEGGEGTADEAPEPEAKTDEEGPSQTPS